MSYATVQQYQNAATVNASAVDGAFSDAQLQQALDAATEYIDSELYQPVGQTVQQDTFQVGSLYCSVGPDGALSIFPRYFPLLSVTSVLYRTDPATAWASATAFAATDYAADDALRRIVVPVNNPFARGQWGQVQVNYTSGYTAIPADIMQACIILATGFLSMGLAVMDPKGQAVQASVPKEMW